jgi:hypothetical protein
MNLFKVARPLFGLLFLALAAPLLADPPEAKKAEAKKPAGSSFIRVQRDAKDQPIALETATIRYVPASGDGELVVDLIGAIHVADRSYYEKLNKQMEQYDVLLYELVAPPGTRIPKGGKKESDNPISFLQNLMKDVLALESQLEHIDYTKKNFVHADLSPQEMAEAMRKRGDTGLTLILNIAADLIRQQNLQEMRKQGKGKADDYDIDLFSILLDPNSSIKLKRLMAQQMVDLIAPDGGLGKTLGTILISDRNQAAVKVLQAQIAKGKKKIGIFYGAAHMPDFEKRLLEDLKLKRSSEQWLTAWDLKAKKGDTGGLFKLFEK